MYKWGRRGGKRFSTSTEEIVTIIREDKALFNSVLTGLQKGSVDG